MKKIIVALLSLVIYQVSAQSNKNSVAGFYKYEVECEGTELDGTQSVRAFGTGKNRKDAIEQAKKTAVYAVIFKGVRLGRQGCSLKPLVFDPNSEEQNQDYFYEFFKDGGKFQQYVSTDDTPRNTKIKEKTQGGEKAFGVIVTVNIPELKKELTSKGIIQKSVE